jgi:hypothetical protein
MIATILIGGIRSAPAGGHFAAISMQGGHDAIRR